MYENRIVSQTQRPISAADFTPDELKSEMDSTSRVPTSTLLLRNAMLWSSVAVSGGLIYLLIRLIA